MMVELSAVKLQESQEAGALAQSEKDCCNRFLEDLHPQLQLVAAKGEKTQAAVDNSIPLKDVPGASLEAENNVFYLNYRGMHLPNFSGKNPDGTPAKPFVDNNGKQRIDGMLAPEKDQYGRVLGVDGQPLTDPFGMRRYDNHGNLINTRFEASDPDEMLKVLARDTNKNLDDNGRAAFNKAIESSDKLDRVKMAEAIESNEKFVMSHTTAFLWETAYRQTQKQLGQLFDDMSNFRRDLNPTQLGALQELWNSARAPSDIDKWLSNPANKESADALSSDKNWQAIRGKFDEYLAKRAELDAKDLELLQKPSLASNVKRMREGDAIDIEYGRLMGSSADTRQAYMQKLLEQDSVKKYLSADDDEKTKLESDINVKEVKRVVLELGKINPNLRPGLESTSKRLGLR